MNDSQNTIGDFRDKWMIWKNNKIEKVPLNEWKAHHKTCGNVIRQTKLGDFFVSTVLLPFEHIGGIFETMVFEKDKTQRMERCNTPEESLKNHQHAEKLIKRYIKMKGMPYE